VAGARNQRKEVWLTSTRALLMLVVFSMLVSIVGAGLAGGR
jgi:hypothetical protein